MKVSARNVFKGQVSQVQEGSVNAEVVLTLPGGEQLVAVVTLESVRNLGIAVQGGCGVDQGAVGNADD